MKPEGISISAGITRLERYGQYPIPLCVLFGLIQKEPKRSRLERGGFYWTLLARDFPKLLSLEIRIYHSQSIFVMNHAEFSGGRGGGLRSW